MATFQFILFIIAVFVFSFYLDTFFHYCIAMRWLRKYHYPICPRFYYPVPEGEVDNQVKVNEVKLEVGLTTSGEQILILHKSIEFQSSSVRRIIAGKVLMELLYSNFNYVKVIEYTRVIPKDTQGG